MPFCTSCGTGIDASAAFCAHCGALQPGRKPGAQASRPYAPMPPGTDFLHGISTRTACILCYVPVFGVIPAIVFLASQRFRTDARVRFNAFQSVYLFVAWLIVSSALPVLLIGVPGWGPEHVLGEALKLVIFGCWIYLLIKAANEEQVHLPVIGDLAARSTTEQL